LKDELALTEKARTTNIALMELLKEILSRNLMRTCPRNLDPIGDYAGCFF